MAHIGACKKEAELTCNWEAKAHCQLQRQYFNPTNPYLIFWFFYRCYPSPSLILVFKLQVFPVISKCWCNIHIIANTCSWFDRFMRDLSSERQLHRHRSRVRHQWNERRIIRETTNGGHRFRSRELIINQSRASSSLVNTNNWYRATSEDFVVFQHCAFIFHWNSKCSPTRCSN